MFMLLKQISATMSMSVKHIPCTEMCAYIKVMKITVAMYFQIMETLVILTAATTNSSLI